MSALRTLRVGAPTRRIGVSPVSDLARRRASLPTDAGFTLYEGPDQNMRIGKATTFAS
jgi:hypothetical protein